MQNDIIKPFSCGCPGEINHKRSVNEVDSDEDVFQEPKRITSNIIPNSVTQRKINKVFNKTQVTDPPKITNNVDTQQQEKPSQKFFRSIVEY